MSKKLKQKLTFPILMVFSNLVYGQVQPTTIFIGETSTLRMQFDCNLTGPHCFFPMKDGTRALFLDMIGIGKNAGLNLNSSVKVNCAQQTFSENGSPFKSAKPTSLDGLMIKTACRLY